MDDVRFLICSAFKKLFKDDKKGEISLHAVRQVNHLIKNKRHHQIPPDCLDILITLRIKDINLDREKEEEISRYKTLTRKEKILIMSKNERRRRKKIERLEKEIVIARAEHSKGSKTKYQTETVKLVFTIYFRILKMAPKSGLMGVVLQGLAKYVYFFCYLTYLNSFAILFLYVGSHIRSTWTSLPTWLKFSITSLPTTSSIIVSVCTPSK
jgi:nucleolar complex protein 3